MSYKIQKKDWKNFPKEALEFILEEGKEYLDYTLKESEKITNRAYSLVLVLTTILISIIGFTFSKMMGNNIDKFVYGNLYLTFIIMVFVLYLSSLIFPRSMMQKGRIPKQVVIEDLLASNKLSKDEIYLSYIIREIEDVQDRIDFNLSKNKKRRDKLEIAMYLIAILLPVYLLISIMFFN